MLKNFFVIAVRNLLKHKLFSFINIFGLALGVAACLVILKYIEFETSYDNFHSNAPALYRVNRTVSKNGETKPPMTYTTYGLAPALQSDIPEVKRCIRTHSMYGDVVMIYTPPGGNTLTFQMSGVLMVDSTFLRAFTFPSISGDTQTALDNPNSIVITKAVAEKYFGREDPIGKTFKLAGGWSDGDYSVSAVIENLPGNSHFTFEALIPTHNLLRKNGQYLNDDGWGWNNFTTYIELNPGVSPEPMKDKLADFTKRNIDVRNTESGMKTSLALQPIRYIHLSPGGIRGDGETISQGTIYFFATIAVFILFIAWINYINLSTARAMERSREVGIKKSIGAYRSQLVVQFFFESVLINFLGIILAVLLAVLMLPLLAEIMGKNLSFVFTDMRLWLTLAALFVFGSIGSGAYPSLALSSFRIIDVLKGRAESRGFSIRKALVVFQFAASLTLIAGTFAVYRQVMYMRSHDKGLKMDQMLVVNGPSILPWKEAKQKVTLFKEELKKLPGVTDVATSGAIPGGGHNWGADIRRSGTQATESKSGSIVWVDPDFIGAYDIEFISGKNFNPQIRSDMESAIVNEASLSVFGLGNAEDALKEHLLIGNDTVAILGVLKNYNWNSLKSEHIPFLFLTDTIRPSKISIHLESRDMKASVAAIEKLYNELIPDDPFQSYFLDDFFDTQYRTDQQFGKIFGLFAILAVIISCLGLWGLASFTTAQKLKEIGVRKVLGASTVSIVYLLTRRFLELILVAAVIGLPLAWYGIDSWQNGFAYKVGIQWDLFVIPLVFLIAIALLTVGLQVVKGASTNPAKVLRSE